MIYFFMWAAAAVECVALGDFWPGPGRPSLTLVAATAMAMRAPLADRQGRLDGRSPDLRFLAWGIGLVRDLFTGGPMGTGALLYLMVGSIVTGLRRRMYVAHPLVPSLVAFGLFAAVHVAEGVLAAIFDAGVGAGRLVWVSMLAALGETLLLSPAVFTLNRLKLMPRGT